MTPKIRPHAPTRDTASVETYTRTTHVVHVDLAQHLDRFDVADEVVLMVATPSGRSKRVAIPGNFLVPSRDAEGWAV